MIILYFTFREVSILFLKKNKKTFLYVSFLL
nr:MAG TPA: hypothetical protein [Caudoviricetes sp.]